MEKVIRGLSVKDSKNFSSDAGFCEISMLVKRGHEECGDSAFLYIDDKKAIIAIFDGVSGESGAAAASSQAAEIILDSLKSLDKADDKSIAAALSSANDGIKFGYTTAAVLFVQKDGSFKIGSIGDSAIFSMRGAVVSLEIPLGRVVKDKDSILKFFHYRNLVTAVLGPSGMEINASLKSGKLKKNDILILASDALCDNLYVKTFEGYQTDSSGTDDLRSMIGKLRDPKKIVDKITSEIASRIKIGKIQFPDRMLVPKEDDLSIVVLKFK